MEPSGHAEFDCRRAGAFRSVVATRIIVEDER